MDDRDTCTDNIYGILDRGIIILQLERFHTKKLYRRLCFIEIVCFIYNKRQVRFLTTFQLVGNSEIAFLFVIIEHFRCYG